MLNRALLYLRRKNKRTVLLFILLFFISFSLAVGVAVWGSINMVTQEVQNVLGTSFVIKPPVVDTENSQLFKSVDLQNGSTVKVYTGPRINQELLNSIKQIDGISSYNAENEVYISVKDLALMTGCWGAGYELGYNDSDWRETIEYNFGEWGGLEFYRLKASQTLVYGNTDTELYSNFRAGAFELVEGRHISADDSQKALVSDELAELNDFKIGDTITLNLLGVNMRRYDKISENFGETELEIVGIYHVNGYQPTGINVDETDITYNWILTDIETVEALNHLWNANYYQDYIPESYYTNLTFFVDDPAQLETVVERVKNSDIPNIDFFQISLDDTMYKSTVEPLKSIRNVVTGLTMAIIAGCVIVLLIVFTMWVRSRRQETAVYLSLGIGKAKILGQFMLEAVIVAAVALAVALPVSVPVSNAVGNRMLAHTLAEAQPEEKSYTDEELYQAALNGKMSELFAYDSGSYAGPEHIAFSLGLKEILLLIALELLIVAAAVCKGGWFLVTLEPRKIMTMMS
ncbi:ABC transporter permease [Agathobaculum desmolans]|uniref:ABC transporter permease n=1 Tax=Agathobaculum desmolans TaxID=39484 RepID=UPI00248D7085|nr:FtsX-like permease family protein [Agathobaculum desmolans]